MRQQNSAKHHNIRARSAVLRWLMITTIDLLLNTPDNVLRIISLMDDSKYAQSIQILIRNNFSIKRQNSAAYHLIALVARLLYFAQFCFNAFYLTTIVYKRNVESAKTRKQRLRHERKVWCRNCNCLVIS